MQAVFLMMILLLPPPDYRGSIVSSHSRGARRADGSRVASTQPCWAAFCPYGLHLPYLHVVG
jgi:hypothetical protein